MTRSVTWVTFAGSGARPMGMQHYQREIITAMRRSSQPEQQPWTFESLAVASLRQPKPADVRVPRRLMATERPRLARVLGRHAYRGAEHVHRFDLRLPPASVPEVVTVHDLPPLRFPDEGQLPGWALRSAVAARVVICPSQFAADEVVTFTGATRVVVVPNGIGASFRAPAPGAQVSALVDGPYVLHVGGATKRKNLAALAKAWRQVVGEQSGLKLVLIGPKDERRHAAFSVVKLGYREPNEIAHAMRRATCVVVPSVYEGFGLPALEAMAVGTPVVAARRGALPEVCGPAAMLVEPDADGLAEGILRVIADGALSRDLRSRGVERAHEFSWQRSAEGHLRTYNAAFAT